MKRNPAISVVLPVYDGEAYVREAVASILAQTYTDFELILVNDGSTDGSTEILREMAALDARIVLVERSNGGLVSALNEGIAMARAELIARMDADDVAMPNRFALQQARLAADPTLGVLGSFIRLMDVTGRIIRLADYPVTPAETARFLQQGSPLAHPTVMMRRQAVLAAGGYRKAFAHCEDYDLWLRISERGYGIANIALPLLNYRMHGANVSTVHRDAQAKGSIIALLAHRMRAAGFADPTCGGERFDTGLIESVPPHLREDLEARLFVLRHTHVSLADHAEVEGTWRHYRRLPPRTRREMVMRDFLLRLCNGAARNRMYGLGSCALAEALRLDPVGTCSLLWRKLRVTGRA